ncbi:hypothetical protein RRG08_034450 [Elysia crispata]|uniref:Uncharacterized protein n=1 Tax=Elysia crispata TaxID=231223 RepID=A0AAE0XSA0_9GAST|nr:hypothetical protein RRG08_034450 [Elysia crispata]
MGLFFKTNLSSVIISSNRCRSQVYNLVPKTSGIDPQDGHTLWFSERNLPERAVCNSYDGRVTVRLLHNETTFFSMAWVSGSLPTGELSRQKIPPTSGQSQPNVANWRTEGKEPSPLSITSLENCCHNNIYVIFCSTGNDKRPAKLVRSLLYHDLFIVSADSQIVSGQCF